MKMTTRITSFSLCSDADFNRAEHSYFGACVKVSHKVQPTYTTSLNQLSKWLQVTVNDRLETADVTITRKLFYC